MSLTGHKLMDSHRGRRDEALVMLLVLPTLVWCSPLWDFLHAELATCLQALGTVIRHFCGARAQGRQVGEHAPFENTADNPETACAHKCLQTDGTTDASHAPQQSYRIPVHAKQAVVLRFGSASSRLPSLRAQELSCRI